jgi:hypothetical protein
MYAEFPDGIGRNRTLILGLKIMVSPVRFRVSPLLFCIDLQVKHIDKEEPRSTIGAPYTNYYTNALGKHRVQPLYGFSLHVRQHM